MLDFVYWPISAILWFWHKVFSVPFGSGSGVSWVLAIVFLTFTIRVLLVKPMLNQMRSSMKMQALQPQLAEVKERWKGDQTKIMEETRRINKEAGVNPIAGCLPILVQMPVFFGLFHVLRSFNRTGSGPGQLGLSIEQNRELANYIFAPTDVQSFLDARLFGVPISSYISMPEDMYQAFQPIDFTRVNIILVAVPLIILTAVATHFNAKMSITRQRERIASGKQKAMGNAQMQSQMEMMNKMMVWFFPAMIIFTGVFWHIGLLCYMGANNIWTFFQQRWIFAKLDREEAAEEEAKKEAKRATAPKPGVRPENPKKAPKKKRRSSGERGNLSIDKVVGDPSTPEDVESADTTELGTVAEPESPGKRPAATPKKNKNRRKRK
ncbi:membrane protein insertase YidC [Corynebacterium sp. CCM 9185]|uniref:Membrane protein insertase YidC n=1 Tax=Corynebacterium marambiense TaxID=2765364 RepID=A0ABS0VSR7_9CORY|nr:membrane protein insertase YidC [Corynebacterium marambiense]MBI8999816.1 membrane protein insertase YidC [Corynebacterium marambiense]MCK7662655.1 membrane protein insertase YidC [Corynebacterium marambiense]MCX7543666.1 membrane protein insertase YidC [Corynebacterium marambiense]